MPGRFGERTTLLTGARIDVAASADRLARFLNASVELMKVMARACGHDHLNQFNPADITTWRRKMADLSGVQYGGVHDRQSTPDDSEAVHG